VFALDQSPVAKPRAWEPVEWDHAETLMVWGPESHSVGQGAMLLGAASGGGCSTEKRPEPSPIQHGTRTRSRSNASDSGSVSGTPPEMF
jgi:hypothetical protein